MGQTYTFVSTKQLHEWIQILRDHMHTMNTIPLLIPFQGDGMPKYSVEIF